MKKPEINILNVFKNNSKKNNLNTFKSRTINITRISNPSSKEKSREKNIFEKFHTKDSINERYNYKSIPLKVIESKSNSKEKINKALKKFEKNINYSKQYCVTLNPEPEHKPKYLSLKTHSNSNEKNRVSRPSTAIPKKIKNLIMMDFLFIIIKIMLNSIISEIICFQIIIEKKIKIIRLFLHLILIEI